MSLRTKSFLRMAILLSLLIAIICVSMSIFLIEEHRRHAKDNFSSEALFLANRSKRLIMWDDRVALRTLLIQQLRNHSDINYIFIERAGRPYVHTFQRGVPKALLGLPTSHEGRSPVTTLRSGKGEVLYDIATVVDREDAILHIGLSRDEIDGKMTGTVLVIGTLGLAGVLIGTLLAAGIAAITTREVNKMTKTLLAGREQLRRQNEFLNNVLESLTHPFYVIDARDYTIKLANSAARLGNLSDDSTCYALTHKRTEPCTEEHICPLEQVKRTKRPVVTEHVHYDKEDNPRSVEVHGYPIFDDKGNVTEMIEYSLDITERKKAEQALETLNKDLESTVQELNRSNKELREFTHIAAHDLKAPLRAIGSLASMISMDYNDKFDEEGKERVRLIFERAERMSKYIDSILRYSKIGRVTGESEKVDLQSLIKEVVNNSNPPENIEITVEDKLPTVMCEKERIAEVFQNLLNNAVKYMDRPEGQIKIGCVEENGSWKFSVADNGPGIEKKYFEKIFEVFQTLSPRDEVEATGIGLSMVKKIVELYGGRVWVESESGRGSTFFFTLPKQDR